MLFGDERNMTSFVRDAVRCADSDGAPLSDCVATCDTDSAVGCAVC